MERRKFLVTGIVATATLSLAHKSIFGAVEHAYKLAPISILPEQVRYGPVETRDAYRFAVLNRDVLRYIPCYCGCGDSAGHTSNASCYVKDKSPVDKPEFDPMSVG
jgi:Protein of unknown function with PCYCGC motif